jgi:hypothetical protein
LLDAVPPAFEKVIAHHVTLLFPKTAEERVGLRKTLERLQAKPIQVIAHSVCAGENIQAVGVTVNGQLFREAGGCYHVTMSLKAPAKPVDSNKLFGTVEPLVFDEPIELTGQVELLD